MIALKLASAVRTAALALTAALAFAGAALAAPTFPELTGRVVDDAHILPPQTQAALTQKLANLEQTNGDQLVVVTVPDLQGYDIADYGYQLGRKWGIGEKGKNNGAMLIIAPHERRVRIEVGYGLEPVLTDAMSSIIIQREMLPRFREGDYPAGVTAGVDAIIKQVTDPRDVAEAHAKAATQEIRQPERRGSPGAAIIIAIIVIFVISSLFRRGGGGLLPLLILSSFGRGGGRDGWGGGGGGGGGFSGGGGSFGGGGASGGW